MLPKKSQTNEKEKPASEEVPYGVYEVVPGHRLLSSLNINKLN